MDVVDLRSDTVTRPDAAMRAAIAAAEVGDDVYGEDPTVRRLEERAAELVGKPAALFVPTGTMANQIALRIQTRPGQRVLAGEQSHVLLFEGGAAAALWGLQIDSAHGGGLFGPAAVHAAVLADDPHLARLGLVALENTHNAAGGRVWPIEQIKAVAEAAREHGIPLHLDGARLFNAAVASGGPERAAEIAAPFDTVSFCLSKGLGAPVGSLVCASRELIAEALRTRKLMGGGMRQAGIIAAAGLHALEHNIERLADDHANARRLATGLAERGFVVEATPETNIVMFRVEDAVRFCAELAPHGVLMADFGPRRVRAVTHLDADAVAIDEALTRIDQMGWTPAAAGAVAEPS